MQEPLISVIIPIYNIERYVGKCILSAVSQTYRNLEIMLVDDGSTDSCPKICDEWASKDGRIKVIHKQNGGQSSARNAALDVASGEFIAFIDGDDYVSPFYLSHLYEALVSCGADMSAGGFSYVWEGDAEIAADCQLGRVQSLSREQAMKKLLYQDGMDTEPWRKLFRRALFEHIRFPEGRIFEDLATVYKLVDLCDKVAVAENSDYFYLQRGGSVQNSKFDMKKLDAVFFAKEMTEFIQKKYPELYKAAVCRSFSTICGIFFQIEGKEFKDVKDELWREIKTYRRIVISDAQARKKTKAAAYLSYLGKTAMGKIYKSFGKSNRRKGA